MLESIKKPVLLSTMWVFILLNMIIRDLHQFLHIGYIQEMMEMSISEEAMLVFGIVAEIPLLMIVLSRILKPMPNKWANTFAAIIALLGLLSTLPNADLDDLFFMVVQIISLTVVVRIAWSLKKHRRNINKKGGTSIKDLVFFEKARSDFLDFNTKKIN